MYSGNVLAIECLTAGRDSPAKEYHEVAHISGKKNPSDAIGL
jgi:hypothetical protein